MRTLGAMAMVLASLIVGAVKCDPGQEGPTEHVTYRIGSGTTLGKANYGLWKADGDVARESCHWSVVKDGKVVAKGGKHDAVLSGTGTKGGVLTATNCGWFYK